MMTAIAILGASGAVGASDPGGRITGEYVEARTAEVFAGGCIMNSEAETMGRQAIMAWKITSGSLDGVVLDGLTVAAAVAGDRNLGMREMGGEEPTAVKAIITVDPRATPAQRDALVRLVRELSRGLITEVVRVDTAPIKFATSQNYVEVSVPDQSIQLTVNKEMKHDPSCGAMQWFKPFTTMAQSAMGVAETHSFSGHGPRNEVERAGQAFGILRHLRLLMRRFVIARCCDPRGRNSIAQPKVTPLPEKPPSQLAPAIASLLQPSGVKAIVGGATLDIWWAQAIALNGDGPGWSTVESGTLVGAMRVTGAFKEIRGKVVAPGVYTLRYGLQPQNGDHLGISTFREFLVISPASVDTDPKVLGFDGVVALSKQVIGTSHPAGIEHRSSGRRAGRGALDLQERSGHDGIVFEVPRSQGGKPAGTVKFGLIVSGTIVH